MPANGTFGTRAPSPPLASIARFAGSRHWIPIPESQSLHRQPLPSQQSPVDHRFTMLNSPYANETEQHWPQRHQQASPSYQDYSFQRPPAPQQAEEQAQVEARDRSPSSDGYYHQHLPAPPVGDAYPHNARQFTERRSLDNSDSYFGEINSSSAMNAGAGQYVSGSTTVSTPLIPCRQGSLILTFRKVSPQEMLARSSRRAETLPPLTVNTAPYHHAIPIHSTTQGPDNSSPRRFRAAVRSLTIVPPHNHESVLLRSDSLPASTSDHEVSPWPYSAPVPVLESPRVDSKKEEPEKKAMPPMVYTDEAASRETQTLRRRCFNCSVTEPPSWRRSNLYPGKIVSNSLSSASCRLKYR